MRICVSHYCVRDSHTPSHSTHWAPCARAALGGPSPWLTMAAAAGVAAAPAAHKGWLTRKLSHALYMYELWTGLYMLDPWEKLLFSALRMRWGQTAASARVYLPGDSHCRSERRSCLPRHLHTDVIAVIVTFISLWVYYRAAVASFQAWK